MSCHNVGERGGIPFLPMIDLISRQTDQPPPLPPPPRSFLSGARAASHLNVWPLTRGKRGLFARSRPRTNDRPTSIFTLPYKFLSHIRPPADEILTSFRPFSFFSFSCTCPRGGTEFSLFFPMTYPPALSSYVPRDSRHFFPSPFLRCTKGDRSDDVGARKSRKREA